MSIHPREDHVTTGGGRRAIDDRAVIRGRCPCGTHRTKWLKRRNVDHFTGQRSSDHIDALDEEVSLRDE
jgi:hypothetical protein